MWLLGMLAGNGRWALRGILGGPGGALERPHYHHHLGAAFCPQLFFRRSSCRGRNLGLDLHVTRLKLGLVPTAAGPGPNYLT